jgi:hypothetical protein
MVELGFCLPKGCSHAGLRGLSSAGEGCSADVQRNGQVPYRSGGLSMLLCCWRYQSARAILWVTGKSIGLRPSPSQSASASTCDFCSDGNELDQRGGGRLVGMRSTQRRRRIGSLARGGGRTDGSQTWWPQV